MKKGWIVFSSAFLLLGLAGCAGGGSSSSTASSAVASSEASSTASSAATSSTAVSSTATSSSSSSSVDHGPFVTYTVGDTTNSEVHDYSNIIVNTPTNALSSDFAYGVDCSVVHEIESLGGRYYGEDGKEEDIFKILAAEGCNYARFRLWVDPYNETTGAAYGGGTNDLRTDLYLAKRAQDAGLKVMIDFHYSDFWADPSHYYVPKAWAHTLKANLPATIYSYTKESLTAFKDAGITINSVQIGNEINTGMAGVVSGTGTSICAKMIVQGIAATKEVFPSALTVVHLTNIKSTSAVYQYFNNLISNGADFDVAGVSYYPYWHGSKSNLQTVLNTVASNTGKPVMICETAWGFTDDQSDYATNQYSTSSFGQAGGYLTSAQGQATEMADLVDVLSKVPNQQGIGLFYWEPDWLPVQGSHWATKAGEYYNDHGTDAAASVYEAAYTDDSTKQSWANQALFSYTGKVLPSAATYKHIKNADKTATETVLALVKDAISVNVNLRADSWSLPTTVQGYTNTGAYRDLDVTWDATAVAKITEDGTYTVVGTASGFTVTMTVIAESNWVQDYSFEEQTMSGQEAAVSSPWSVSDNTAYGKYGTGHIESKGEGNLDGSKYYHWYNTVAFTWNLSQTVTVDWAGKYRLRTYFMSNDSSGYSAMDLWVKVGSADKVSASMLSKCAGWNSDLEAGMQKCELTDISIPAGSSVTFGLSCTGEAGSWGHNDLWSLVKTGALD
jgi:arabinogalactan endo-1,4-beta-galactosidase